LGAEGKWTDDRFRLPGVDPALRVTVEPFAIVLVLYAEVDEARSLEVEDDVILEVEVDEARFFEVEEEATLVEVELARFCFEIDLILVIRQRTSR